MYQHSLWDNWSDIKASLLHKWDAITNEDLDSFNGNIQLLVETITRPTSISPDNTWGARIIPGKIKVTELYEY